MLCLGPKPDNPDRTIWPVWTQHTQDWAENVSVSQHDSLIATVQGLCTGFAAQDWRVAALTAQVQQLTSALAQSAASPPSPSSAQATTSSSSSQGPGWEPKVGSLERYAGDPERFSHSSPTAASCLPSSITLLQLRPLRWHSPLTTLQGGLGSGEQRSGIARPQPAPPF